MLPIGWLVLAVVLAVLLTMWVTFTLTRLDRLHARVDAAEAALDAQLVRRAVAVQHLLDATGSAVTAADRTAWAAAAQSVLALEGAPAGPDQAGAGQAAVVGRREALENALGRAAVELLTLPDTVPDERHRAAASELREAAARVLIARRFYNDAVRDTRALRARRMPRLLHLAGHRAEPDFFDIDDTLPPARLPDRADATLEAPAHTDAKDPHRTRDAHAPDPEEDR